MNKLPDRAKRRREYLRKKSSAYSACTVCGLISVVGFGLFILILVWEIRGYLSWNDHCAAHPCSSVPEFNQEYTPYLFVCCVCFVLGSMGFIGSYSAKMHANTLPYVPPVREQLPTLPAEEILLRGSQVRPASPEELLRPAGSEETKAGELLRPANTY